ncbi:hypothetical protein SLEP1_g10971 [Rubroshorea leprosula]|uniref:Uncharacterized protein n=1 Tax=Rubroshorea leprosula TaxID=152421 RepID=A0AAV5IJ86_9ROSI|nr:hypothetical protein SLEP1_g10971 [Rubroshorea leprosula]
MFLALPRNNTGEFHSQCLTHSLGYIGAVVGVAGHGEISNLCPVHSDSLPVGIDIPF